ncbi:hypothetical protein E3Q23_03673 [Wallemia mellicola]|uniref:Cupredoxin n=1 Tax=Wallemia mellicola TaxID=1708541 RepID=A0A4T0LG52_9BASI|nr:hypothetical protein E3Q24_03623 [Wallemia mellicola]TIB71731.1 hypothetical protein E3Q23_03673 [Wallemia mellicola]TIB80517.1 Cupredoxin [Wallemia mellicola]TIB84531.1 Cupredoxin [Wallemia mellicola]TIB96710.1 Cupredoxin [Wallemia mellicola]
MLLKGALLALFNKEVLAGVLDDLIGNSHQDISIYNHKFTLNVTEVLTTLDGGKLRNMFAINGKPFYGAQPLVIDEDDVVEIEYINNASSNTTLHAHGIVQQGTMYSDGVPGVSQTPIQPGQNFTYKWKASDQYGLYWLHSHYKDVYQDGQALPLYIRPKNGREKPFNLLTKDDTELASLENQDKDPQIIMISEYASINGTHEIDLSESWNSELLCYDSILINSSGRKNCPSMDKLKSYADENMNALIASDFVTAKGCPDVVKSTPAVSDDTILDPDLWYNCEETNTDVPKFEFDYVQGSDGEQWGVFHMVSASSKWSYIVSIDEHPVYLYSQDGNYHKPMQADAFELVIGESIGIGFKLHTPGEYTMRISNLDMPQILGTHAIIRYGMEGDAKYEVQYEKEEGLPALPKSKPTINYGGGIIDKDATFVQSTHLKNFDAPDVPLKNMAADKTLIMTIQYDGTLYWGLSDNGTEVQRYDMSKMDADTPALFNLERYINSASSTAHYHAHSVVDVVFIVNGTSPQPPHPMHFHGLHRFLLAVGTGPWDYPDVGEFDEKNPGVINWDDPAYLHTFNTAPSTPDAPSYLVTRFHAGAAEPTLLHCHVGSHKAQGMEYLLIAEGEQQDIPDYYRMKVNQ